MDDFMKRLLAQWEFLEEQADLCVKSTHQIALDSPSNQSGAAPLKFELLDEHDLLEEIWRIRKPQAVDMMNSVMQSVAKLDSQDTGRLPRGSPLVTSMLSSHSMTN